MEKLGDAMNIPAPIRIEAFDNSNIMGTDPVSAMVVFIDGKPAKKNIVSIKLKQSRAPMTMPQCERLFIDVIHVF